MIVLLDSGPLWRLVSRRSTPENDACAAWLDRVSGRGDTVYIPEIADYEVRRETLRSRNIRALNALDTLGRRYDYLPITTEAMRLAAEFWADARHRGLPGAPEADLDADVILAAQASLLGDDEPVVVASENPRHLAPFVSARPWTEL